jgi:hypothetical protein
MNFELKSSENSLKIILFRKNVTLFFRDNLLSIYTIFVFFVILSL